ncbi:MAG: hypothetical protein QW215_03220 [Ignisphaera sp.]
MSLPAVVIALTDLVKGARYTSLDAEAIRVIALGIQKIRTVSVSVTVPAGSTASDRQVAYDSTNTYIVVKSVKSSSAVKLHIICDGNESVIPVSPNILLDIEAIYGYRLYGSRIEVWVEVDTPPETDTEITIELYGGETATKVQTPTS